MVLIESESDDETTVKEVPNPSHTSSSQPETAAATDAELVGGDDSDGFETASEREVSDNEGDESDRKQDAITNQESEQSDKPENKEEQVEAVNDSGANQVKICSFDRLMAANIQVFFNMFRI